MKPGVYDISIEDYHASEGISRSGIMRLHESAKHYWDAYLNPDKISRELTDDLILGDMVHTMVLEHNLFDERFAFKPDINRRSKAGKAAYHEFEIISANKTIITDALYEKAWIMAHNVIDHPEAKDFIEGGLIEKSIYWIDEDTEILCKARPDIWFDNVIVDLKTTKCAAMNKFKWSVIDFGYHVQAAMMLDGIKANGLKVPESYMFITVEKKRPFLVTVYFLSDEKIQEGRLIYKRQLEVYALCKATDTWSGYQNEDCYI